MHTTDHSKQKSPDMVDIEKVITLLILIVVSIIFQYGYFNVTIIQDMREKKEKKIFILLAQFLFLSPTIILIFFLLDTLNR